jgi:AcrR family transcriptional regulator
VTAEVQHRRNKRGEGARLREEIVAAAAALLEQTGDEDAVTLRRIARQIGIAAPSIYRHFPDRDAIIKAVMATAFAELDAILDAAQRAHDDPMQQLHALCQAYLTYAADKPHCYLVAFGRHRTTARSAANDPGSMEDSTAAQAFNRLVAAITRCSPGLPHQTAVAVWVALHGYASLTTSVPAFPWPERRQIIELLVDRMHRVT